MMTDVLTEPGNGTRGAMRRLFRMVSLPVLFSFLTGCTSLDSLRERPEGETGAPLEFGLCQPGALWPEENDCFQGAPGAYERYLWAPYLRSAGTRDLLDDLGAEWLRVDFSWKNLEPVQGVWRFRGPDLLTGAAVEQGRKVLALLVYDVPWIYDDEKTTRNITPERLEHYLNYVETVALRYRDRVGAFEIWNEPNFHHFWKGSDEDFFLLTRETLKVLERTAPDVPVAVGSLMYHPAAGGKAFLKKMIEAGALEGADALSLHPYGASVGASALRVAEARQILRENGLSHRIWVTEMGYPTTGAYPHRVPLDRHAAVTAKSIVLLTAAGADLITWYKLSDRYNPDDIPWNVSSEAGFGLTYPDRSMKPGGYAYSVLTRTLSGARYNPGRIRMEGDPAEVFTYDLPGDRAAVVLWARTGGSGRNIVLEGLEDAVLYRLTDETASEETLKPPVCLTVNYDPVLLTGKWNRPDGTILIRSE